MVALAFPRFHKYTVDEYLMAEEMSSTRHEYLDGDILAMAGGSFNHAVIIGNCGSLLTQYFWKTHSGCRAFPADLRIGIPHLNVYTYADGSVVCGEPQIERRQGDNLLNPTLLLEVLSPSTEQYDRTTKFEMYKTIDSLRDYLLISQERIEVLHYTRIGDEWHTSVYLHAESVLDLSNITAQIPIADLYRDVKWDES